MSFSAIIQFLKNSVSTVLAHSPVLYDEDLTPTQRRAFATADSFEELEKVRKKYFAKGVSRIERRITLGEG